MRYISSLLAVLVLNAVSHSRIAVAEDLVHQLQVSLEQIAAHHENFLVRGMATQERFFPKEAEFHRSNPIIYRQLGNEMRFEHGVDPGGDRFVVSTESLSFEVEKRGDGSEVVKYMSPSRGLGFADVRQSMLNEVGVFAANWSFHFDSYADMLREGRLELVLTDRSTDSFLVFDIVRMVPRKEVLHPESTLLHYEGELVVANSYPLRIDSIKLKTIYPEGEALPPAWLSGKFKYREDPGREVSPLLATAVWEMRTLPNEPVEARWTFEVNEIEYGTVHPDDFTLAGCCIKTVNTLGAYSNIPLLVWYGGMVFVLCVIGIWLLRRSQQSIA